MVLKALLSVCLLGAPLAASAGDILFNWFDYKGDDKVFAEPIAKNEYRNPIVAGFYPDPSITRAGETFYMVHSSFAYSPGIPLLSSTDLVNWQPLGHILTRHSQQKTDKVAVSEGMFAPTIRFHDGTFYMLTTGVNSGGNFLVSTKDPTGEWSEPVYLPEIDGIDPDIFFDDDGKVYIWLWEFDLKTLKVKPGSGRVIVNGGVDISQKPIWIEGPHIYKINDWYYLLCAEGGTGDWHSEVVFRTRSLSEAFVPYSGNPILTQRHQPADRENPISAVGHADIVQTSKGEWWAVFLGTRNYETSYFNTGRETFLLPVSWKDEWPVILEKGTLLPYTVKAPSGLKPTANATPMTGNFQWRDTFNGNQLKPQWSLLRSHKAKPYRFISGGGLTLQPRTASLADATQPAFIARRQQHLKFSASTNFRVPTDANISAGITAFQGEKFHYFLGLRNKGNAIELFLEQANNDAAKIISTQELPPLKEQQNITLGIEGDEGDISFYWQQKEGDKKYLAKNKDAKILSTSVAGGFVGTHLGIHARTEK